MSHTPFTPEWIDHQIATARERLEAAARLDRLITSLSPRDQEFACSLLNQLAETGSLSPRQWPHVDNLLARIEQITPIYGNFIPIFVMFRIAGEHIKRPKIRLVSDEGTFVQLNFYPIGENAGTIKIFRDGWQGHGRRKFVGWIRDDQLIPYSLDRLTDDIKLVIQSLALDPAQCAKTMAQRLSACMYCATRLSDPISKSVGYGPICAEHFGLPWGSITKEDRARPRLQDLEDLNELFS